jgi:hypothetical protein
LHLAAPRPWLKLATWSLVAHALAGAEPASAAEVRLRAAEIDFARLAGLTRTVMRQELGELLAPASLALSWRRTRPSEETDADELRVVLLRSSGVGGDQGALASTSLGGLAPTIWVYVPIVARTLDLELDAVATSPEDQRLVGVALGRVLAHEVVHLLAPEVEHADTGVMRSRLHAFYLTRGRPALEGECAAALARGARAWRAAGGSPRTAHVLMGPID